MAGDRVNELYRGEIFQRETQITCRERIHWICAQATGRDVLDIGCSQGIASLLLGREGHQVVGVDVNPDAVEYAQNELTSYPDAMRDNVRFMVVQAGRLPFEDDSFDTVLLGEILEHQTRPQLMLAEVCRLLRPGGLVVVTTPFGVHPDPDHVRTFYLGNFVRQVEALFETVQIQVLEKYICFVGRHVPDKTEEARARANIEDLLELSEQSFERVERKYLARVDQKHADLLRAKEEVQRLQGVVRETREAATKATTRMQAGEHWRAETVALADQLTELINDSRVPLPAGEWRARIAMIGPALRENGAVGQQLNALIGLLDDLLAGFAKEVKEQKRHREAQQRDYERLVSELETRHQAKLHEQERDTTAHLAKVEREYSEKIAHLEQALAAAQSQQRSSQEALTRANQQRVSLETMVNNLKARLKNQSDLVTYFKNELSLRTEEVRYKLGDAFVKAASSPTDFVLLPGRMTKLFLSGMRRRRERRRLALPAPKEDSENGSSQPTSDKPPRAAAAPVRRAHADRNGHANGTATHSGREPRRTPEFDAVVAPQRAPRLPVKAAVIMDEFTYECFRTECRLTKLDPQKWRSQLQRERPDFLFVESAWRGNDGAWTSQLTRAQFQTASPLLELLEWCAQEQIPTVFWNKEDPPNFEHFIYVARRFDYIFTTDEDCVPLYRRQVDHDRVYAMPFAAQPAIHNPIDVHRRIVGNICFAGTYYAEKHSDRQVDMEILLRPALRHGLHVFDRMHEQNDPRYQFPPEYAEAIHGALSYPEMLDAYKRYRLFLNVNSVKDSPTMFSRRVFELLACGTPVISTPALGIERLLGGENVPMVESHEAADEWMGRLLNDRDLADRIVQRAQRRIFREHTYEQRLRFILEKLGIAVPATAQGVSVVTCTNRPHQLETIIANYLRQDYAEKELVVMLNDDAFDLEAVRARLADVPNARAFQLPEHQTLGACLNEGVRQSRLPYVAKFDDDNHYGADYLNDMTLPFIYSDATVVGKNTYYAYLEGSGQLAVRFAGREHRYTDLLQGGTLVMARKLFDELQFEDVNRGEDTQFLQACRAAGYRLYSADRFNFVLHRAASLDDHTWKISEDEFLRSCEMLGTTADYRAAVTV